MAHWEEERQSCAKRACMSHQAQAGGWAAAEESPLVERGRGAEDTAVASWKPMAHFANPGSLELLCPPSDELDAPNHPMLPRQVLVEWVGVVAKAPAVQHAPQEVLEKAEQLLGAFQSW